MNGELLAVFWEDRCFATDTECLKTFLVPECLLRVCVPGCVSMHAMSCPWWGDQTARESKHPRRPALHA